MKHGSKLNIKKLPKLDLEINYAKIQIHTQPKTNLELNQILFYEKTKIVVSPSLNLKNIENLLFRVMKRAFIF